MGMFDLVFLLFQDVPLTDRRCFRTGLCYLLVSRDNPVGVATRYGLDGPGIESWWGQDFPHPSRPALGPTQPPIQWVPGLCRGVERPGCGVDHPPHLAARFKNE